MPAAPMRADAGHAHAVERDLVLRVGRDRQLLGQRDAGARRRRGTGRRRGRRRRCARARRSAVAADANGTCHFTPSSTKPSPSAVAVACTPRGPKPLPGSSHAVVRIASPVTIRGSHSCFCSSVPGAQQHARAHDRAHEVRRRRERAAELHVDDRAFERAHLRAAVLRREHQADEVELGHLLPQLGRVADRVVLERAHRSRATRTSCTRRAPSRAASPARR